MNFMLGGALPRYNRIAFCSSPFFKHILISTSVTSANSKQLRIKNTLNSCGPNLLTSCSGRNHEVHPCLIIWTQIRSHQSQKPGCPPPKFHRDIEFPNFDGYRKEETVDVRKTAWGSGDSKPGITYVVGFFGFLCGGYGLKTAIYQFVTYMSAPADVLALASVEVDISKIAPGGCLSYKWRGKPLFIKNRTEADISVEANTPMTALRDPETPEQRCVKPDWLVVIGICTHLGCVPIPNSGDWSGGFYCPCHGSHYDNLGRARKGPAPLNLEVPPHKFISDTVVLVG